MRVSNTVENNTETTFTMSGVDKSIANALRRIMLSEIQCVAMRTMPHDKCDVVITTNTCRFNNEIIKQRLSCVPVHITDMSTPIEQLKLEVDVCNDTDEFMHVTTQDIKILNTSTDKYLSEDDVREIFPVNQQTGHYVMIARLRPRLTANVSGEHLAFTSKLSFVDATENSMFNVVSTCSYGNTPDKEATATQRKMKEQELKDSGVVGDDAVFELTDWSIHHAQRIFLTDSFDFTVKTIGVLSCKEILQLACDRMGEKILTLFGLFDSDSVKIDETSSTIKNGYDVQLKGEDYTIGMLLQHLLFVNYYEGAQTMTFCAAKKLHPHDPFIVVKVGYKEEASRGRLVENMKEVLQQASEIYRQMHDMF